MNNKSYLPLSEYLKNKILVLIVNIFGMIFLTGFLLATAYPLGNIILILLTWAFVLLIFFGLDFIKRRRYFHQLFTVLDRLDKRYLIGEVMESTDRLDDQIYREIIRKSNKAVIEKINQIEDEQKNYREYIETWIHEVKAPLTAMILMCDNLTASANILTSTNPDFPNHLPDTHNFRDKLKRELKKLENYVDLALFYARSDHVHQDYLIKKIDLAQTITQVLQNEKYFFIEHQFSISLNITDETVYTDEKWFQFILKQILLNAIKYRKNDSGEINIYSQAISLPTIDSNISSALIRNDLRNRAVRLIVEDHGIGIPEHELGRIFEKGFTGSNGRKGKKESTGIGLFLCKKLCDKMDIGITAESKEAEFTRIIFTFPVSEYYGIL